MGNIHSVNKALEVCGARTLVTNKPEDIRSCDMAVLPGVGAFDDAMQELQKQGLVQVIKEHILQNKPFLGICLGMQLLFETSEEGKSKGLGILKGRVKRFEARQGLKVPQMGWNQVKKVSKYQGVKVSECPLLSDIPEDSFVYFCHSYYSDPQDKSAIAATCDYGIDFACAVARDNVFGMQFHPEKSQKVGLKILESFIKLC
jgi:glutamine amidotransferase